MNNQDIQKQTETKVYKEAIAKCSSRIFTLKLAIKGLVGHLPEYVVEKLVDIAGDISTQTNELEFYEKKLKSLEEK